MKGRSESVFSNRVLRWTGIALFILVTGIFGSWLAAKSLIVRADLARADALVVLAGSSTYQERALHTAELYRQGRASQILLTNDSLRGGYSPKDDRNPLFVELATEELMNRGVPSSAITIVPGTVASTYDEAVSLREYAEEKKLRSILIVTSGYQSRRALWTMRRVFDDTGIQIGLAPVEPGRQSPPAAKWWRSRLGWQMVPGEYVKLVYYRFKY